MGHEELATFYGDGEDVQAIDQRVHALFDDLPVAPYVLAVRPKPESPRRHWYRC